MLGIEIKNKPIYETYVDNLKGVVRTKFKHDLKKKSEKFSLQNGTKIIKIR